MAPAFTDLPTRCTSGEYLFCAMTIAPASVGITSKAEVDSMNWQEEVPPRRRILIIEDSVDIAEALRELLELNNHCVEVAYDGTLGIELAGTFGPELVICDIGLPDIDGYEVARTLRRDERFARVILVALSGYARPDDSRRALEAGFDSHLTKPPDLARLGHFLDSVQRRHN